MSSGCGKCTACARGESFRRSVKGLSGAVSGGPDPRQANLVLS